MKQKWCCETYEPGWKRSFGFYNHSRKTLRPEVQASLKEDKGPHGEGPSWQPKLIPSHVMGAMLGHQTPPIYQSTVTVWDRRDQQKNLPAEPCTNCVYTELWTNKWLLLSITKFGVVCYTAVDNSYIPALKYITGICLRREGKRISLSGKRELTHSRGIPKQIISKLLEILAPFL